MIDIDALEALAKTATPGPWEAVDYGSYDGKDEGWYVDTSADKADIAPDAGGIQPNHWDASRGRRDMQFIAATNPVVILALIAEVRALREDAERWRTEMRLRNDTVVAIMFVGIENRCNIYRRGELIASGETYADAIDAARGAK